MVSGAGTSEVTAGLEVVEKQGTVHELSAHAHKRPTVDVEPLLDLILVYREDYNMSKGGLHLPIGTEQVPGPRYAKVIAIGPGRPSQWNAEIIPMPDCKPGDTVLLHAGAGTEWTHEGTKYFWILPGDLIGVVQ